MKKLIFLLAAFLLINGCKDDSSSEPQIENGGIIYTFKLVEIETNEVTQDEYQATFGDREITVVKIDDNKLMFQVPPDMELGEKLLTIASFNNLKINYEVKETLLTSSAEETFAPYLTAMSDFINDIQSTPNSEYVSSYYNEFNTYYNNTMSQEDKILIAKYYKVNKDFIDGVVTINLRRNPASSTSTLLKFKIAIATLIGCVFAVEFGSPTMKAAGLLIAIPALYTAYHFGQDFLADQTKVLYSMISNLISELNNKSLYDNVLEVTSGEITTFPLASKKRALISSDSNDTNLNIITFFDKFTSMNSLIGTLNTGIEFVNEHVFFSNLDLIPLSTINDTNPISTVTADQEYFNNLSFSISDSNISLDNVSFDNGNISIKATIIDDTNVDEFVETTLNFTYNDDFNSLSGYFPIKVYKDAIDLSGSWQLTSFKVNGEEDLVEDDCRSNWTYVFTSTESDFYYYRNYGSDVVECVLWDVEHTNYSINDGVISFINSDNEVSNEDIVIVSDTVFELHGNYTNYNDYNILTYIKQ